MEIAVKAIIIAGLVAVASATSVIAADNSARNAWADRVEGCWKQHRIFAASPSAPGCFITSSYGTWCSDGTDPAQAKACVDEANAGNRPARREAEARPERRRPE